MLTDKEKTFAAYWEKQRQRGRWIYAFRMGVLFWAIPVYLLIQLFYYLFRENYVFETGRFVVGFIVWIILGFFAFGLITWWLNERNYQKLKTKNPEA
jgi:hypothetical protein